MKTISAHARDGVSTKKLVPDPFFKFDLAILVKATDSRIWLFAHCDYRQYLTDKTQELQLNEDIRVNVKHRRSF